MPSQPLSTAAFMAVHCKSSKRIPSLRTASSSAVNATGPLGFRFHSPSLLLSIDPRKASERALIQLKPTITQRASMLQPRLLSIINQMWGREETIRLMLAEEDSLEARESYVCPSYKNPLFHLLLKVIAIFLKKILISLSDW